MKIVNIKTKLFMTLVLSSVALSGCQGSRNNSNGTPRTSRPILPGQNGRNGLNPIDSNNVSTLNRKGDNIVFPTDKDKQVPYDSTDYTHVVNPNVVPVKTGYSRSELVDYTDAGNDNIMERLKIKLGSRTTELEEKSKAGDADKIKKDLKDAGWDPDDESNNPNSSLKAENEKLARNIISASLTKGLVGSTYTLKVSVGDIGELSYTLDTVDLNAKKTVKNALMEIDSSSDDTEALTAKLTCLAKSSVDVCSTAVVRLQKVNDLSQAYIVFRRSPANLYLGEYTSKLLMKPQGDIIIDQWHQFFSNVINDTFVVGSTDGQDPIAEIKSFAVVNGIAGFELNINRIGYPAFTLSGDLEISKKGPAISMNSVVNKRPLDNTDADSGDYISETIESAALVHNNGRGMLQIGIQLIGFNDGIATDNGGIKLNEKATKSLSRQNQLLNRASPTFRTKSSRLQDKANRALRITIVPVKGFGVTESLL